ncbi:MAG: TIGR00159 family protein [Verrucomicrobiales bacterium]|nr:TIGR00159 family protein [Verrucomicrobiales bacterium]|tara:strand:+ start:496 stop:1416 length:921 start_codon:yes stop_codon:yes gene_type:complete
MIPEPMLLVTDLPGWLLDIRDWWLLNWLWMVRAVAEIGVLAVVIYYAFQYLKRTRGWPVVAGFLLLMALTLVTEILHLQVLSWLLQAVFAFLVLAILILFQPELRRLLAGLGNLPIFNTGEERQQENIVMLIDASRRLARSRTGALIVVERAVDVHHDLHSAVEMDCKASAEVIESLFFPNSPLHDGGVIISGERISHAACIFPLTSRQDIRKTLGTRHRAAIGITEDTDALAIIVSEETGAISYCQDGALHRDVDLDKLNEFLEATLVEPEKKPEGTFTQWRARLRESLRQLPERSSKTGASESG